MDNKDFGIGAQILHDLNISKLKLINKYTTNKKSWYDWLWFRNCRLYKIINKKGD